MSELLLIGIPVLVFVVLPAWFIVATVRLSRAKRRAAREDSALRAMQDAERS